MRDADGNWYPDPPSDPAERALWKRRYFAQNYGAGKQSIERMLADNAREIRYIKRVKSILVTVLSFIGALLVGQGLLHHWRFMWAIGAGIMIGALLTIVSDFVPKFGGRVRK